MDHRTGPVAARGLLIAIDRTSASPMHEQLERSIRENIRSGRLQPGTKLPSTRGLAEELGVSRGVVVAAYGQLAAEGYLETRQGAPVRVARGVRSPAQPAPARSLLPSFPYNFHPGLPDLAGFPREAWLRSLRAAWRESPHDAIGYGDPRGVPQLRQALAEYLGRARGAVADPEHMLISTGFTQGFSLACRWLANNGVQRIAVEEPGWHTHRLIAEQAGLEVTPVAVDRAGPGHRRTRWSRGGRRGPDPGAPVPHRSAPERGAQSRAHRLGRERRPADRRGRLRRRVPL